LVVWKNDLEAVRSAMNDGMKLNQKVYGESTLFDLAARRGNLQMQQFLVSQGSPISRDAVIEAVRQQNLDAVKWLVDRGINVNYVVPETGFTALMLSASCDTIEIANYLLQHGADPYAKNKWGKTASDLAHTPKMQRLLR
jgi:ankyrin repeat protein